MIKTTMRVSLALACAAATLGCAKTLDQRFQAMCDEQKADPETWVHAEGMCKNGKYIPDEIKQQAVDGWEQLKGMKANLARDGKQ